MCLFTYLKQNLQFNTVIGLKSQKNQKKGGLWHNLVTNFFWRNCNIIIWIFISSKTFSIVKSFCPLTYCLFQTNWSAIILMYVIFIKKVICNLLPEKDSICCNCISKKKDCRHYRSFLWKHIPMITKYKCIIRTPTLILSNFFVQSLSSGNKSYGWKIVCFLNSHISVNSV